MADHLGRGDAAHPAGNFKRGTRRKAVDEARGELVASGTPETIAAEPRSYTGQFLKELLERRPGGRKREAAE